MTAHATSPVGTIASAGALVATDIHHAYADREVLRDCSITVATGRRLGLVGDNGSGKSTLLRILAGREAPDRGTVVRPPDTALLEQELPHPPSATIGEVVEEALAELRDAARHVQELAELVQRLPEDRALAREYGDALEWAQLREAWDADHRVDRVLRGLGLDRMPRGRAIGELSGGERARVAMAALLVRQPRVLLLDEPSNHLDDAGLAFLERHLVALPGSVVVASHDRALLDAVCTDIVDLDPARGGITRFRGTFSEHLGARARERDRWTRAWLDQQAELAALERSLEGTAQQVGHARPRRDNDKLVHNFRGARSERGVGRRRRAAHGRIEQLRSSGIPRPPRPLQLHASIGRAAPAGEPLVRIDDATIGGRLAPASCTIEPGARLLVTGANGAGKSTLLLLLAGLLDPDDGCVAFREELHVGLLPQDPAFAAPGRSARRIYEDTLAGRAGVPELDELGLLRARDLDVPVAQLSEGQRRRLALALLIADAPELLLLDEPTNHLSPSLVSELEAALEVAPCAVVVASHDRWLRSRWQGRELRLEASR